MEKVLNERIPFEKQLEAQHRELFCLVEKVAKGNRNFIAGERPDTAGKRVVVYHFARAAYLLDATFRLCRQGFATEAMVLLRSLLNLYINIKWLMTGNSAERIERFIDFGAVYEAMALDRLVEYRALAANFHPLQDFELVKKKYGLRRRNDFFRWTGKSIRDMAREVDLLSEYDAVYSYLSAVEHTGFDSIANYLIFPGGKIVVRAGPRDKDVSDVLLSALGYYLHVEEITRECFGVDCQTLKQKTNEWSALAIKYRTGVTVSIVDA